MNTRPLSNTRPPSLRRNRYLICTLKSHSNPTHITSQRVPLFQGAPTSISNASHTIPSILQHCWCLAALHQERRSNKKPLKIFSFINQDLLQSKSNHEGCRRHIDVLLCRGNSIGSFVDDGFRGEVRRHNPDKQSAIITLPSTCHAQRTGE